MHCFSSYATDAEGATSNQGGSTDQFTLECVRWALRDLLVLGYREGMANERPYDALREMCSPEMERAGRALIELSLLATGSAHH